MGWNWKNKKGSVMGSVNGAFIGDDARSHMSGYSLNKAGGMNLMRSRSLAEGQSQRAMSAMSGRYLSSHPLHHLNGNLNQLINSLTNSLIPFQSFYIIGENINQLGMNGMMGSINGLAGMPGMPGMPAMPVQPPPVQPVVAQSQSSESIAESTPDSIYTPPPTTPASTYIPPPPTPPPTQPVIIATPESTYIPPPPTPPPTQPVIAPTPESLYIPPPPTPAPLPPPVQPVVVPEPETLYLPPPPPTQPVIIATPAPLPPPVQPQSTYIPPPPPAVAAQTIDYGQCGVSRPVFQGNGDEAVLGQFPWHALILHSNGSMVCSGALVTDKRVVTSSHCVHGYFILDFSPEKRALLTDLN